MCNFSLHFLGKREGVEVTQHWIRLNSKDTWMAQHNLFSFYVKMYRVLWKYLLRKKNKMEKNGNTYRDRVESWGSWAQINLHCVPSCPVPPPSFYFALSLSIQRNMYNYKGYKKGSNINRQKYTELIFTCLLNVRKSSYAHTEVKKIKTKRKQKECRVTFRYL